MNDDRKTPALTGYASRRSALAAMAGAAAVASGLAVAPALEARGKRRKRPDAALKPDRRPNVVLIIADDMRSRDWPALKQTRSLLRDGSWYPNFIINCPVCSPSRVTMMTGQYAHNHGVGRNAGDEDNAGYEAYQALGLDNESIALALESSGYRTAMIGKFLNGWNFGTRQPRGWSHWVGRSSTSYTDFDLEVDGRVNRFRGSKNYLTDVLRDYACDFIREVPAEQPLYLYLSMGAPHAPFEPARRHRTLYGTAMVERDPTFNEADITDKPFKMARQPLLTDEQVVTLDGYQRLRWQTLASLDEAIVRVVETLDATGRLANTVIMVVSDNGLLLGHHRVFATKGVPYDQCIRVPMLASGPGFGGKENSKLVSNADIVPTIADLAGVKLKAMDGFSLLGKVQRDYVPLQIATNSLTWGGFGLRSSQLMYFEQIGGERELYDLRWDPTEAANLLPTSGPAPNPAGDLPLPADLSARLAIMRTCKGSRCR